MVSVEKFGSGDWNERTGRIGEAPRAIEHYADYFWASLAEAMARVWLIRWWKIAEEVRRHADGTLEGGLENSQVSREAAKKTIAGIEDQYRRLSELARHGMIQQRYPSEEEDEEPSEITEIRARAEALAQRIELFEKQVLATELVRRSVSG